MVLLRHYLANICAVVVVWFLEWRKVDGLEKCQEKLEWFEKYFVDDTQTFSLRICCNVTKLWLGLLRDKWRLEGIPALNWVDVQALSNPGFDLVLSQCPGGKIFLGEVTNRQCTLLRGNIATFSKGFDEFQLPEFDSWYVSCLQVQRKPREPACLVCKLDVYCTAHYRRCRDTFAYREIVNASRHAVTILVQMGDLPFEADVSLEVLDSSTLGGRRGGHGASVGSVGHSMEYDGGSVVIDKTDQAEKAEKSPNKPHYYSTTVAMPNSTLKYEIDGLKLNSWYVVRTCLHVTTPASFYQNFPQVKLPKRQTFCLEDEGYQTQRAPRKPKKMDSPNEASKPWSGLQIIFLAFVFSLYV